MPPELYVAEAKHIVNNIKSKKTNEDRVFGIMLANKEFREIVGCEFAGPTPPSFDIGSIK